MPNASIGGLVSGLDTASIINQLMQLEAQPQNRLKSRVATEQSTVSALQALNAKLAALTSKAGELSTASGWTAASAKSSIDAVTATAATTTPGSFGFTVNSLATSTHATYASAATATSAGQVAANTTFDVVRPDGTVAGSFDSGDGSLSAVASAINTANVGLSAALVRVGTDSAGTATYRLSVTSKDTGAVTEFSIAPQADHSATSAFLGGTAGYVAGSDAEILMDAETAPLTSASNTFKGLMPGVDVTLGPGTVAADHVTITVAPDSQALADKVKAMVDAVNAATADMDTLTNYNSVTKKSGLLGGDSTVRSLRDQLVSSITHGVNNTSLASVGIQVDRYGKLTFDADAFKAAYVADPTKTMELFVDGDGSGADEGVATTLETLGKNFSNSTDGVVTSMVKGHTSTIDGLDDAIDGWDVRLALKRTTLERQYGALEVALGKMQNQASWLAGQISGLPSWSSGS